LVIHKQHNGLSKSAHGFFSSYLSFFLHLSSYLSLSLNITCNFTQFGSNFNFSGKNVLEGHLLVEKNIKYFPLPDSLGTVEVYQAI
jgi:hypothetical protein